MASASSDSQLEDPAALVADVTRTRDDLARISDDFQKLVDRIARLSLRLTTEGGGDHDA
jgi:hypothetical protein